jgi:hypothetical protein
MKPSTKQKAENESVWNVILIKDTSGPGFTAFFAEFPEVVIEAKTEEEAKDILIKTTIAAMDHRSSRSIEKQEDSDGNFVTRPVRVKFA